MGIAIQRYFAVYKVGLLHCQRMEKISTTKLSNLFAIFNCCINSNGLLQPDSNYDDNFNIISTQ